LSTALADIYKCFPNRVAVTAYEVSAGPPPMNIPHAIADAITTPRSQEEAAASNGVYTRALTGFYLPAAEVSGWTPQAGYLLVVGDVTWIIDSITPPIASGLWLCKCVALYIDPERADTITIYYPTLATRDDYGSRILTPAIQRAGVPCWIQPLTQTETDQLDKRGFTEFYYCYVLDSEALANIVYGSSVVDQFGDAYIVLKLEQRRCYRDADRLLLAIMPEAMEVSP
jgi:hypothetical protein